MKIKNFVRIESEKIENESSGKIEIIFSCGTKINIDVNSFD